MFVLPLFLIFCKKERNKNAALVRDCTGTYLRIEGKDYQVCNLAKVAKYTDGTKVSVTYKKIDGCKGPGGDPVACYLLHPNEGWIEVEKIE